jgi:hypothetical protein
MLLMSSKRRRRRTLILRFALHTYIESFGIKNFSITGNRVRIGSRLWQADECRCGVEECEGWEMTPIRAEAKPDRVLTAAPPVARSARQGFDVVGETMGIDGPTAADGDLLKSKLDQSPRFRTKMIDAAPPQGCVEATGWSLGC